MNYFPRGAVTCDIIGGDESNRGIGNQLFCVATAIAYAARTGKECVFPQIATKQGANHYKNLFYRRLNTQSMHANRVISEVGFHYSELPIIEGNVLLKGYFQSEKYFSDHRDEVMYYLNIEEMKDSVVREYGDCKNLVSIHVRRGDYLSFSDYHHNLTDRYYKHAIAHFSDDDEYLIFSDDLQWCRENFDFIKNKRFSPCREDHEDMILMSTCRDHIIANSSFSWWSAWLNTNFNKRIIAPKKWFGPKYSHDVKDVYCEGWHVI